MSAPILATKLYIPPPPARVVRRPRLVARLNEGMRHKLTLVSAPAGFGKTTLVSEWVASAERPVAWLSLDGGDNDPARFLAYLVAALQTVTPKVGDRVLPALESPQPPPTEWMLTTLLNEVAALAVEFALVLDDYHVIEAKPVDEALRFLVDHLPPQMRLVIATREDPPLPLARLRARGELTEVRAADLRFTPAEAAHFLNGAMGLDLTAEDIAALETRTEGWIAGLQLAALSMQGHDDPTRFIESFTGSHHFIQDYLIEEVLQRQPDGVQTFLLRTSILDRLCGPLCAAVLNTSAAAAQDTLEFLDQANLFVIPLDDERRWYRYHHLFRELLRQRLQQSGADETELHTRASQWYEDNGLAIEAFHHAAAANDIERAERLISGHGIPRHFRGAVTAILNWLSSLPKSVLDARPALWWLYASLLLVNGQTTGVEEKLQAALAAVGDVATDAGSRALVGRIATARGVLALTRYDVDGMLTQSRQALAHLPPQDLTRRANATWTLGQAYLWRGDREAARQTLTEAVSLGQAAGDVFATMLAIIALGRVQETDNDLYRAADTYQRVLQMAGDQPLQIVNEAHLGLARILYEWNDLAAAEQRGQESLQLARQYDTVIDRAIVCEVFLARVRLALGDVAGTAALLAQASATARERNFVYRIPEVAAAQVAVLLRQGELAAAQRLVEAHDLPMSRARLSLAQGDPSATLTTLEPLRRHAESMGWADERLQIVALQAIALDARGDRDAAIRTLNDALALAEPGGFIRVFVDEGSPMAQLLLAAAARGSAPEYVKRLLAAFATGQRATAPPAHRLPASPSQPLVEPLSERELEVLRLVAEGLSNREIGERLFLALNTVKGYNRVIFEKLQVARRTEAVARARELGLL
ncbi:MAG: LuxR family transcriptional regulator [Anaerolineae bacterium]|nr:LuxR family transcriptional regulator [Anaerolineae bacterium]